MTQVNFADAPLEALLSQFWDLAIYGAGYPGFAAALTAEAAGLKVLLIDRRCDLLWESSRTRNPEAGKLVPEMAPFMRAMACATGIADDWIDPGSAEWVANELLMAKKNVTRLYFAQPVAAKTGKAGLVESVTFALRNRLGTITAAKWIDASETGELARLCGLTAPPSIIIKRIQRLFFQCLRWGPVKTPMEISAGIFGTIAHFESSRWSSERILNIEMGGAYKGTASAIIEPMVRALRIRIGNKCEAPLLTHWSFEPYPVYAKQTAPVTSPSPNLALAVPALSTGSFVSLGERFNLGVLAANKILNIRRAATPAVAAKACAAALPEPVRTVETDVFVAGLGTGGLLAAIAAGRAGSKVFAADEQPSPGGVPVLAGIPAYYYGCPGGLQTELDIATQRFMTLFATPKQMSHGYHALARRMAADTLLGKAKVETLYGASLLPGGTVRDGDRIVSVLLATPSGLVKVVAKSWIDATSEGFLAAEAGVPFDGGRPGDGSYQAFTQSWGAFGYLPEGLSLFISNIDCGHADPDDSLDMTTARIAATHHLVVNSTVCSSNAFNRTTGVMPTLGIRRGKLAHTRYRLTIDDLVCRSRFPDAIGITGGHVDNHSTDYFAESADLCFYNWCASAWAFPTACEIPYGAILPEGVSNLWMACRAAGCTDETSNAFRMQRDMQRIGEAAGIAASLAAAAGVANGNVPLDKLRAALTASGALPTIAEKDLRFGCGVTTFEGDPVATGPATAANIRKWVSALGDETGGIAAWRLYRLGPEKAVPLLKPLLGKPGSRGTLAALILGALGESSAAPHLAKIVAAGISPAPAAKADANPTNRRKVPSHVAAAWALGRCGGQAAFKPLADLASDKEGNSPTARLAALWAFADIARRGKVPAAAKTLAKTALAACANITVPLRPWERAFVAERLRKAVGLPSDADDFAILSNSPWRLVRKSVGLL